MSKEENKDLFEDDERLYTFEELMSWIQITTVVVGVLIALICKYLN